MNRITYRFTETATNHSDSNASVNSAGSTVCFCKSNCLFQPDTGYGFLTQTIRKQVPNLEIPELTDGFEVPWWLQDSELIHIQGNADGCFLSEPDLPLTFQATVEPNRCYQAAVTIKNSSDCEQKGFLFSGRRRFEWIGSLAPREIRTFTFPISVYDIIPRNHTERFTDSTITLTLMGSFLAFQEITVVPSCVPTLFIAGDSTVTDQTGTYPYVPEQCYCAWGQSLPLFLNGTVVVSNHAHSGLTTESFRDEGHYAIVSEEIKPGDFFFFQFAHNDQKLSHLKFHEGYRENLIRYIKEIREKKAIPVLVTPLARNTWRGDSGTYNDLLADYAEECRAVASEYQVLLVDLNKKSTDFILEHGLEDSKRFFFPGDYTHTNDFGSALAARFVAEELLEKAVDPSVRLLKDSIRMPQSVFSFLPPKVVVPKLPPDGLVPPAAVTEEEFLPSIDRCVELATRAEAVSLLIQAAKFFPTNVYNDRYEDVVGHEWYAGAIECASQNGIIDPSLLSKGRFLPEQPITGAELALMAELCCQSRKGKSSSAVPTLMSKQQTAEKTVTREELRLLCQRLRQVIDQ